MKLLIHDDPKKNVQLWHRMRDHEEEMVRKAEKLAEQMKQDKERQLRNIQEVAEQSTSWAEVELFIRYQAARGEIPKTWADQAIKTLSDLREMAQRIAQGEPEEVMKRIHLELIRRVLGYTVRWHVWHVESKSQPGGG